MQKVMRTKNLESKIEDLETEGYKIQTQSKNQAELVKRNLGKAFWHILIFLITVWFTFGLGNLLYLIYSYFVNADKITLKKGD